jgi:hypothetical protein
VAIISPDSLAETIDALNDAFFYRRHLSKAERERVAKWIADRQGKPGAYADMFAPTKLDYERGIVLFTGERLNTQAGTGHILGEESCRALILLDAHATGVREALKRASEGMIGRLRESQPAPGWYCCGRCTSSYWRHLAVGGLENCESELESGMKVLKRHRDGAGRWNRFPFYYTLLALSEIDIESATDEMKYAAAGLERVLRRTPKNKIDRRRVDLAERVLEKC